MKVLPFNIPKPDQNFLIYQEDFEQKFYDKFHQHEEFQISFILKGSGTLLVGESIHDFNENDVILLSGNLPHVFKNDESETISKMLSLFFQPNKVEGGLFCIDDLYPLKQFLTSANSGLLIKGVDTEIQSTFKQFKSRTQSQRILLFLTLLEHLMDCEPTQLSNFDDRKSYSNMHGKRMEKVMDFSLKNFKETIRLDEIAKISNMSKNAFCKYFKNHTDKSYLSFINELRINHAAKLLISNTELMVVEVAENSGFNNLSNFNRQFKKYKGCTPLTFRKEYR